MDARLLLTLHAVATWLMTGIIWFVQVVHYPLFARVGGEAFLSYERAHVRRVVWLVTPVMLVELATGLGLLVTPPAGLPTRVLWLNTGLLALIWISTGLLQLPAHARLRHGFEPRAYRLLVRSNWARTVAWTIRSCLLFAWMAGAG